jgi:predicted Ser/Thr protein kinase
MNIKLFIKSLTKTEKEALIEILKNEGEPKQETLDEFLTHHFHFHNLSTRWRNVYQLLKSKEDYADILSLNVEDVTLEDLSGVFGVGKVIWKEFIQLRGY